jgi:uncharacterized protein YbjT (DUF2867 family)
VPRVDVVHDEAKRRRRASVQLFEIGGPDRVAYADLMREYARQAGLRRAVIRVPLATPRVSGLWLSMVTPV